MSTPHRVAPIARARSPRGTVRSAPPRRAWYARPGLDRGDHEPPDPADPGPVTRILQQASQGDPGAWQALLGAVYGELRSLAQAHLRGERASHTLQPTALVHEAYLRLLRLDRIPWRDRAHFFRAAAESMRRILIDHARAKKALKRGEGRTALEISNLAEALAQEDGAGLLALDAALERLEEFHPEAAQVVRLKFYAGLDNGTAARVLGLTERTARREWTFARGWLRERLERELRGGEP